MADPGSIRPTALAAGEEAGGPWWMQATALDQDRRLELKDKPWWTQAAALKVDEKFMLDGDPPRMMVRREKVRNVGGETEAIVWIIDDDEDNSLSAGGDLDSDCYVVDYGGDGVVDRIVDYIDDDGDQEPDEMDIRYFERGELRSVWVGVDLDDDGRMWDLAGYEYSHNFFASDPYGNEMIFMNKFDPARGAWVPVSECPFAFYDTDGDGYSEEVVRVSAVPLDYSTGSDPDYANDPGRYRGQWSEDMRSMGVVNVRYSFDIDNLSSSEFPLHYDYGFNLVGATPYEWPGMERFNAKRRPPQVTVVLPHESLRDFADRYRARETGFTWHECQDDTIAIGHLPDPKLDLRWEGVFWMWERRFMGNTGGPGQKWNVRREWTDKPVDRRELYYSEVDRRIHLFGAKEGWIEVGHFSGLGALGEIRMFDTDSNGYFDRWEVYRADQPTPVRVTTVRDERAQRVPFNQARLHEFYTGEVLPQAMAANERLLAALQKVSPFEFPQGLRTAIDSGSATHRRYAQDIAREMHYQDFRRKLTAAAQEILRTVGKDDLVQYKLGKPQVARNSAYAWRLLRGLQELDVAYGQGEFERVCELLTEISAIQEGVE
ncbi:MAG: hypothetical protein AMXMBFR13_32220 [Phycisphaerae bacterium]